MRRYDLLSSACDARGINVLAVAHHLEDQAETFLLRLSRRSSITGLAGMHRVWNCIASGYAHPRVFVWRPFLDVSKVSVDIFLCILIAE